MLDADSISKPMFVPPSEVVARPLFDRVHEWIVTVDHKKLGLMYIGYGILFLVIGGVEATIMRIQLAIPHNHFVSPQTFNQLFTMHGTTMIFLRCHANRFWIRELPGAADDRRARHGVPAPQRLELLDERPGRHHPVLQFYWRRRTLRSGRRSGRRLVRLRAAYSHGIFRRATAPTTGSSDLLVSGFGSIGTAAEHRHDHSVHALPRHDPGAHAAVRLAEPGDGGHGPDRQSRPLTAAQIMLLIDRYLGGHFFDTQAGGSAVIWMHFFWIFGHPEVYVLVIAGVRDLFGDRFPSSRASRSSATPLWWRRR